jgi:hypothetical protein
VVEDSGKDTQNIDGTRSRGSEEVGVKVSGIRTGPKQRSKRRCFTVRRARHLPGPEHTRI